MLLLAHILAKNAVTKTIAAGLIVAALLGSATAVMAQSAAENPDIHRFRVGAIEAVSLRDGGMSGAPNDNAILGVGRTPQEVAAVLTANNLPGDTFDLSIQPLLVVDSDRVVLIDAGGGGAMGPIAGKLPASLRAAGFEPDRITDVLISHGHGDHVAGLIDGSGALTFPNAVIRISAPEWTAIQADTQLTALVAAITPKVETFAPGAALTPSITAVAIEGHTPGHSGYEVRSGAERLLYIGDTAHHSVISVQRPEWAVAFDNDPAAMDSRIALLNRAAAEDLRIYAVHFPFPGVGRVEKRGDTLVWVPEAAAQP